MTPYSPQIDYNPHSTCLVDHQPTITYTRCDTNPSPSQEISETDLKCSTPGEHRYLHTPRGHLNHHLVSLWLATLYDCRADGLESKYSISADVAVPRIPADLEHTSEPPKERSSSIASPPDVKWWQRMRSRTAYQRPTFFGNYQSEPAEPGFGPNL